MSFCIITAFDERFYPLGRDLIASIREHEPAPTPIVVLDVGLTEQQRGELAPLVTRVLAAEWDFDFPGRESAPAHLRAMTSRPHLPRHVPGYDVLLWIDADAWLADWRAVELMTSAAGKYDFAIVPELDRAYRYLFADSRGIRRTVHDTYAKHWPELDATRLAMMPLLNAGMFAIRSESSVWDVWSRILAQGLRNGWSHLVEQCALNLSVYMGKQVPHLLPAWCNWNAGDAAMVFDEAAGRLVAPYLPHEPISMIHLIDFKGKTVKLSTLGGKMIETQLDYSSIRKLRSG